MTDEMRDAAIKFLAECVMFWTWSEEYDVWMIGPDIMALGDEEFDPFNNIEQALYLLQGGAWSVTIRDKKEYNLWSKESVCRACSDVPTAIGGTGRHGDIVERTATAITMGVLSHNNWEYDEQGE